jgi:hypothetical protein
MNPSRPRFAAADLSSDLWDSAAATTTTVELRSMSDALFWEHAHRHRLSFRYANEWATDVEGLHVDGATELISTRVGTERSVLLAVADVLIHARLGQGRVRVSMAAASEATANPVIERLRDELPAPEAPPDRPCAQFTFSWRGETGPLFVSRMLDVAPWDEIADNYPAPTRAQLDPLMRDFRAAESGQTIVWHGEPGTGKTNALRALAYEWSDWCTVHVVTDPDRLFGSDAGYLMEVIAAPREVSRSARHRLIVLEDSGELLTGDARRVVGHGLSRFLNVCDGLLGQSEKLSLLVTTNEPLKRLHPAVRRPGRCAAEVEFGRLDVEEANRWLAERTDVRTSAPVTLAQLYALASGSRATAVQIHASPPIGFAAALGNAS